jgi:hypothetical protein
MSNEAKLFQKIEILKSRKDNLINMLSNPDNQINDSIKNSAILILSDLFNQVEFLFELLRFRERIDAED